MVSPFLSNLKIVRSMPVATWVVTLAWLLVSSASKLLLSGSTFTSLVIVPRFAGATTMMENDSVDCAAMLGLVQTRTLSAPSGPAGQEKELPGPLLKLS